jgi:hypothetical protein
VEWVVAGVAELGKLLVRANQLEKNLKKNMKCKCEEINPFTSEIKRTILTFFQSFVRSQRTKLSNISWCEHDM